MPLSDLSNPDVLLRENWESHLRQSADGTPLLSPAFVAEAGPRVWLVDVRSDQELLGSTGHIPGVWRMPLARIGEVKERLSAYTPVVLICTDGGRSQTAARYLRALGMTTVAAMDGGMVLWRAKGYGVSRSEDVLGRELTRPEPGHGSDGRLLSAGSKAKHLTADLIREHVGDPAKVRRVKLAAFLLATQTSCVDGREDRAIIGTPGGDAGELVLGLGAAERVMKKEIDVERMPELLRAFADTFGGVYLHTDNGALNRLARALRTDDRLQPHVARLQTIDDWESFLRSPEEAIRPALLEHLLEPDHVGCGHLKLMVTRPAQYGVRPALPIAFMRAFYTGLWEGAPDHAWVVLGGAHAEGAVVNVTVEGGLGPFSEVPMIAPSIGGVQMFVNHPQVVDYLRDQNARFLARRVNHLLPEEELSEETLTAEIKELGGTQAGATLSALAAGLPVFTVHFQKGGAIAVDQHDPIPS